ncbi:MAG: NAD+ synthase [Alphaproteobacteria bacterium]|nr:NAD+ synthase [Alphaproteobacteria bacterium]
MTLPLIALAQINVTVGDIAGNSKKILTAYETACKQGAELVVFPECALIGYPPEDLVLMPAFRSQAMAALGDLAIHTKGRAAMIIGSVWDNAVVTSGADTRVYNAAVLLDEGRIQHIQPKTHLPNYGIFDEKRLFDSERPEPTAWRGRKLGVMVCEDIWSDDVAAELAREGAECLIILNGSPFEAGKHEQRIKVVSRAVKQHALPAVYVNLVGGQDDIVFDGGSFVMNAKGEVTTQFPWFEESIVIPSLSGDLKDPSTSPATSAGFAQDDNHQLWQAMQLGLRDYVEKNGFKGVLLGLSGGIDSAITATCAVDALGASRVRGVLMPSLFSSQHSIDDAQLLARNLGIHTDTIPITPAMETYQEMLGAALGAIQPPATDPGFVMVDWMQDVAVGGNIQARIRGQILMALSNKTGFMLLSTGNKSEIAVGYTTLYGDACGGYNVIKDLYKTEVYALANWRNEKGAVIPQNSISKPPSAELKPGQLDSDQLPPYEVLDAILQLHIEQQYSASEIIAKGYDKQMVEKVVRMVRLSEYKRRQSCPGVKLSAMLFGKDRRYPLTSKW